MAEAVVSILLEQVATLIREESSLLGGLRYEVQHMKDELGQMKGFLGGAEAIEENYPELQAWVKQVRDVAYDIEDVLEEFILRFGRRHHADGFLGRVRKGYSSIKNLKARHQIVATMHTINGRIKDISEAHERYQKKFGILDMPKPIYTSQNAWYDSRGDALLLQEADLVGIERPKKKLMNMIFKNDSQLRVISVVGTGGLGKTTLVKKVYDDANVKKRFEVHVWITMSQSFNIETLLKQTVQHLFKELNQTTPEDLDAMNENCMKQLVQNLLQQEKYILVLDDIWRTTNWYDLQRAFPENNCGSRIIITTRIADVGRAATSDAAGDIYPLDPLTKKHSWTLFCRKAFRDISCPDHLKEDSRKIIERCAGLPLAIVVIGGVMATKSRRTEEWNLFNTSLGAQMAGNDYLENMNKLLFLSYYELPEDLRICFLYLSILPEDVFIEKNRLIRLWIGEGFVQNKEGMTIEEVAESYVTELINRSLIQVAKTTKDGQVKACRIHDIIQQIILRKARDQNMTTIFNEPGKQIPEKIRRLVIQSSIDDTQVSNDSFKYLRSLILFESIGSMSKLFLSKILSNGLRLVKVLDLEGAPLDSIPKEIFKLLHLKNLSLRNTNVKTIPKSIRKLKKLEILDLKYTNVTELPIEISKLKQLRHLLVLSLENIGFQAPYRIGKLQSLQSLCYIDADQMGSMKIVKEIGKLIQLRKLRITKLRREDGKELCSSLEKLRNLRSLSIFSSKEEEVMDLQYSLSSTPQFLRKLILNGRLERAPQWILSLDELTSIKLLRSRLRDDPLQLLQDLRSLKEIELGQAYEGEGLCFKAGGFQVLKTLRMWKLRTLRWVRIEKGAMPVLDKLEMKECKLVEELPAGIEHLKSLQHLSIVAVSERLVITPADYKRISHIPQVIIPNLE